MRHLARVCLVGLIACGALGLTGCVPSAVATPSASARSKPVFESDAAALDAATKAYAAYLAMSDTISQEGGANPERIAPLVTPEWLAKELAAFQAFSKLNRHQVGETTFRNVSLQEYSDQSVQSAVVVLYVCSDFSTTRFLDADDVDQTPANRQDLVSMEVQLTSKSSRSPFLVVSGIDPWQGAELC
jgi:hypothetical protein